MRRLFIVPAALALLGLGVACGDEETIFEPQEHTPASVEITPGSANLLVGDTHQLAAEVLCQHGLKLDVGVNWATDNPAIATVDATGKVVAKGPGVVTITAAAGPAAASVMLNVTLNAVGAGWIVIEPAGSFILMPNQHLRLKATVYDETGTPQPTWEVRWTTSDDQCAAVFQNGLVRGRFEGPAVITATSHGVSDFVQVEVREPLPPVARVDLEPAVLDLWVGQSADIEAFAYDAAGNRMFDWVDWSSADPTMVTVDANGQGVTTITAIAAPGMDPVPVEITGVCGGVPGTLTVWINNPHAKVDDP